MTKRRLKQIWVFEDDARQFKVEAAAKGVRMCDLLGEKASERKEPTKKDKWDIGF